jgi:hypothetical protein
MWKRSGRAGNEKFSGKKTADFHNRKITPRASCSISPGVFQLEYVLTGRIMATHVRILGVLHIVFGVMGLLFALVLLLIFGGIAGVVRMSNQGPDAQVAVPILAAIGTFVFFVLLILSLPGIIAGIGLLQFRPWARILTIVLSALELMSVPFGTAIRDLSTSEREIMHGSH